MRLPLPTVPRSQHPAEAPLLLLALDRTGFGARGRNRRRTGLTRTRDEPSACARDSQPGARDHRRGRSGESPERSSGDRPSLRIARLHRRTILREFQQPEETPRYESFVIIPATPLEPDSLVGQWKVRRTPAKLPEGTCCAKRGTPNRIAEHRQDKDSLLPALWDLIWVRPKLAKSRYPEYKK